MPRPLLPSLTILAIAVSLAILSTAKIAAQPGTQSDPVVSLSYLKTAVAMQPVTIEGGEDYQVAPGKSVALLQGRVRLTPPAGSGCWILSVKTGTVCSDAVEMTPGSYYILIAENSDARFTLQAWEASTIALPGGSGE